VIYLLDSSWIVSFLNGRPEAIALIRRLTSDAGGELAASVVAWAEVYQGLLGAGASVDRLAAFEALFDRILVIPITISIARHFAAIRGALQARGTPIGDNDTWIAATAIAHGVVLVTRDRHFERVPDLKLYAEPSG
jgi:predicted nucleic acid-binding protein